MQEYKTYKVVVCGTGFGMFYIESLRRMSGDFEIVGIVARGSERSKKCASFYNISLYHSPEEVPDDVDIVCVAVRSGSLGGEGTEISLKFLEKGIHVILEQPVHHEELKQCFQMAQKHKCCFMTGDLYMNMPEVRRFFQVCNFLRNKGEKIEYIRAGSCVQAFYPFTELILHLVPGGKTDISYVGEQQADFKQIIGTIGSIPFTFQFNNTINPKDPDNHMQILHNFCCYFSSGRLELVDTRGPLLWYPRMNMPWSVFDGGGFPEHYPENMLAPNMEILTPDLDKLTKPYHEFAEESWISCISYDLQRFKQMIADRKQFLIKAQQEQKAARLWNELTQKFGFATLTDSLNSKASMTAELNKAAVLPEEQKFTEKD